MYGCERIEHRIIAIPHTQLKYSDGIVNAGHMSSIEHTLRTLKIRTLKKLGHT